MRITHPLFALCLGALLLLGGCKTEEMPVTGSPPNSPAAGRIAVADGTWQTQTYNENAPNIQFNPLKGLVPAEWEANWPDNLTGMPFSLEYFYIPLSDVMTGYDSYNWTPFDNILNRIKGRGNHAIPRFYLDYPGWAPGTPGWLQGLTPMRSYNENGNNGVSKAPDWNDEDVVSALERFVRAYGNRYNGDARIGVVQVGLYGFWGEWHTWPYQPDGYTGQDWRMNQTNRNRVLRAFHTYFPWKQVAVRDPLATNDATLKWKFGYFDDSFDYETLYTSWHFWEKIKANGLADLWKYYSMGGEIRPEIWSTVFNQWPPALQNGNQNFIECVNTTHVSWLWYQWIFDKRNNPTQTQKNNALNAHKMLGYRFYASAVKLQNTALGGTLSVGVRIQNKGVAPFPYDWDTEFYAVNPATGQSVKWLGGVNWNIHGVLPDNTTYEKSFTVTHGLARGTYRLLMRTKNPNADAKPLRYANENQDLTWSGFLTLGDVTVN
jgi:hypothetical protein